MSAVILQGEVYKKKRQMLPLLLIAPSVLLLTVLVAFPLVFSLRNSFYFWNLQMSPKPLTYKAMTGASTLVGAPMDPTLAAVPYYQGTYAPPPAPPNIGTPPKHERGNAKAGKMHFANDVSLKGQGGSTI